MPDDAAVLGQVQAAFAQCERPEHFTDRNHCEECAEHDELLRSRVPDTLRIADVANPGWDPLCYVDAAGFGYFFPGLARLALAAPDPEHGWYGSQLLYHLNYAPQGEANRHLEGFSPDQRRAVAALLRHIDASRQQLTEEWGCREELMHAIALWSAEAEQRNAADSRTSRSFLESLFREPLIAIVRQPAMILRIFRVEIDPSTRSAFEAGFRSLSADAVTRAPGNLSCEIGMPTQWAANTYSMITRWRDEDALVAFAGPEWNTPVIPAGMEAYGKNLSVEHYWIDDSPIGEPRNAADLR